MYSFPELPDPLVWIIDPQKNEKPNEREFDIDVREGKKHRVSQSLVALISIDNMVRISESQDAPWTIIKTIEEHEVQDWINIIAARAWMGMLGEPE